MSRNITVASQTLIENIIATHHFPGERVEVITQSGSMVDRVIEGAAATDAMPAIESVTLSVFVPNGPPGFYLIDAADYAELTSAAPAWSPSKPAGTFRTDDLWHFVDKYRGVST